MRTRERAHEATIVFVVIVIVVGTSTSFDDDRGDVDAATTREGVARGDRMARGAM